MSAKPITLQHALFELFDADVPKHVIVAAVAKTLDDFGTPTLYGSASMALEIYDQQRDLWRAARREKAASSIERHGADVIRKAQDNQP